MPSNLFQKTLSAPCHTELASRGLVPFIFANAPLFAAVICLKRDIFLASFAAKLFYRIFLHQFVASLPHWLATEIVDVSAETDFSYCLSSHKISLAGFKSQIIYWHKPPFLCASLSRLVEGVILALFFILNMLGLFFVWNSVLMLEQVLNLAADKRKMVQFRVLGS